jgi:hypothetical protein
MRLKLISLTGNACFAARFVTERQQLLSLNIQQFWGCAIYE